MKQLNNHMEVNALTEPKEPAHRKYHSAKAALLRISNNILCAVDKSQHTMLKMLDQSAAFDTVNQDELHQLHARYGI